MPTRSVLFDIIGRDNASKAFLSASKSAETAAAGIDRSIARMDAAGARMTMVGQKLSKAITLPVLAAAGVAVDQAAKWQKSMTLIQTAGGETAAKAAQLSSGLQKLAVQTGTSLGALGEGIYTIAKAGADKWSATEQLMLMKAAAEGAKAENVSLATATDALSTVMLDYHAKAQDSVKYENQLIRASGLAKTTFQEFSTSLANVTPIAAATGLSFKEIGGAIATMTQHGVSAQQATENLRNLIFNLSGQNNVASAAMQQLGINTVDLTRNLGARGLTGTLAIVDKALKDHTHNGVVTVDVHKAAALATRSLNQELGTFGGKLKDQSKGLVSGNVSIKDYTKYAKSLGGEAGAAALQFLALYKNSQGFSDQLRSGKGTVTTTVQQYEKMLGGMTGAAVAMQIAGKYAKDNARNVREVGKAALEAGSDVLGWNKTQDTLAVKMDKAKASLQVMAVEIGNALIPAVSKMAGWVSKAVDWFDHLSSGTKKFLGVALLVGAGLGPVLSIVGRLTRGFALLWAAGASTGRFIGGIRQTEMSLASMQSTSYRTGLKVGNMFSSMGVKAQAFVRGLGALAVGGIAGQVGGGGAGGWLTSIMLGGAGGWAVGGPVGGAIGAVSAAISKGIGLWNDHKQAAKQAAEAEKAFVDSLTSSIQADNGALGTNLRLSITKTLQSKGVLDAAQKLGINLSTVVDAAMGNKGALQSAVVGPEQALNAKLKSDLAYLQKHPNITAEQAAPVNAEIQRLNKQIEAYDKLAGMLGLVSTDVGKAKAQFDQAAHALNDNRVAAGNYTNQLAALRKHTSLALDANGQLNTSLDKTQVVGQHNRATITNLAAAALADANNTFAAAQKHHTFAQALQIATGRLGANIKGLETAAAKAGLNKGQVDQLIKTLDLYSGLRPSTTLHLDTRPARNDLEAFINSLPTITVNAQMKIAGGPGSSTYNSQVPVKARKALGGDILGPGTGTSDSVLIAASNGEFVVNAKQAAKHHALLTAINSGVQGFASGGTVGKTTLLQSSVSSIAAFLAAAHNFLSTASDLSTAAKDLSNAARDQKLSAAYQRALAAQGAAISGLAARRDSIRARLGTPTTSGTTAYDRLAAAQQAYTDAQTSVSGAVGAFDITQAGASVYNDVPGGTPSAILTQIQAAAAKATQFAGLLKRLGREGLNRVLLMQLAQAGPAAFEQAQALATATPATIGKINAAQSQLTAAGNTAGKYVADRFYKAGVDSARGLVNGLLSQEAALNRAIKHLGDQMIAQLKHTLRIKSPSQVTHQLGVFTGQGFELGIRSRAPHVASASKDLANAAMPRSQAGYFTQGAGEVHNHWHLHGIDDPATFMNRAEAHRVHREQMLGRT